MPAVMNPVDHFVRFLTPMRRWTTLTTSPDPITPRENHNWNTTCIGIMTIATVIIIGLFGSFELAHDNTRTDQASTSAQPPDPARKALSTPAHGSANEEIHGFYDGLCLAHTQGTSKDDEKSEPKSVGISDAVEEFIPALVSTLSTWAIAAYLACLLFNLQTIFAEFPTRRQKIDAARFASGFLLIEAGFVGVIAILTVIQIDATRLM